MTERGSGESVPRTGPFHCLAGGDVGGKASGLIRAWRVLNGEQDAVSQDASAAPHRVRVPYTYILGADAFEAFLELNPLVSTDDPTTYDRVLLPPATRRALREAIEGLDDVPLIVRSSSLLEDRAGIMMAGKYRSIICSNQGDPAENLHELEVAVTACYASIADPEAVAYRRWLGNKASDEAMAVLIQPLQGARHGPYWLPLASGVALSRNDFRWSTRLQAEEGLLRVVLGLGSRAVSPPTGDYPRLVPLSHPALRPETTPQAIWRYSQHEVDVVENGAIRQSRSPNDAVLELGARAGGRNLPGFGGRRHLRHHARRGWAVK